MKKQDRKFLKQLLETPSPTGAEEAVAALVRKRVSNTATSVETNCMGSVHARLSAAIAGENGQGAAEVAHAEGSAESAASATPAQTATTAANKKPPLTVMLAAHMDEVGLMVHHITDDGFLNVSAVGGVDAAILPGLRVDVHTQTGTLRGVVGRKPIHLITPDERKKVTPISDLVIDLGLPAKKVKKLVRIGDEITYGVGFERFGKNMAVSRAFDDKCGVFVGVRVLEELARAKVAALNSQVKSAATKDAKAAKADFVFAATVQEEIGTRGGETSAFGIHPSVGLAFDVTHATDYPGINKSKYGDIKCGKGPVIARGPNINPCVFERLVCAAEAENIPYQIEAEPGVTGTDARVIQMQHGGIPTGLVSVPLRYMHTPTEVINLRDLDYTVRLITRFVLDLDENVNFIPGEPPVNTASACTAPVNAVPANTSFSGTPSSNK